MKASKYCNVKTFYNGIKYDSKLEATYAQDFDIMRKGIGPDQVIGIQRQLQYAFKHNGIIICNYILDFKITHADGRVRFIDVKGYIPPIFRIKAKLMKAFYGIDIEILPAKNPRLKK